MAYTTTTFVGLKKATPGTNQAFETTVMNLNWDAIENKAYTANAGIVDLTSRVTTLETSPATPTIIDGGSA
jgi:hypothetical protein